MSVNYRNKIRMVSFMVVFLHLMIHPLLSQITITRDDMPDVNDTIRFSRALTTGGIDHTLTGENYTWDYSILTPFLQQVDTFVSVSSTPVFYQLVFLYPFVATISQPVADVDIIPGYQVTDIYMYYKETDQQFHQAGVALTLAGIPLPMKYDGPDILYTFPMNYGNIDSCESTYELNVPDLFYYDMYKSRKNTVDGWGILTTPFGTYETLRIKSEVFQTDSLYIDSLNFGFKIPRNYIQYKWMANGFGVPVLQIDEEGALLTVTYIDSLRILTSVTGLDRSLDRVTLFPNPTSDQITIEWDNQQNDPVVLSVHQTTGIELSRKTVYPQKNGQIRESLSFSGLHLTNGAYLVRISSGKKTIVKKVIYIQ